MISAFKHIRLSGYNLLPQSVNGQTRLTLNSSGIAYFSELSTASGILNTKINDFSGTFQSFVNNLDATYATDAQLIDVSGALLAYSNATYATVSSFQGLDIKFSNATGALVDSIASTGSTLNNKINSLSGNLTATYATIGNLASTGSTLNTKINSLSGYSDGKFSTITNLGLTGSTLNTKIDNLSGYSNNTFTTITSFSNFTGNLAANFATDAELIAVSGVLQTGINTVATNLGTTGSTLNNKINSLSGNLTATYATIANLASTGSTLDTKINSLSGNLTSDYVRKATQQQFIVNLPINVESTGILFPVAFASTPNSVQVTFEPSTDVAYMVAVKNRTTAGFTAEFSDVLFETGNKLNVFASV
jgi:outer membrane murein-binding lipoprotein Lpp